MTTDLNFQKTALRKETRAVLQKIPPAARLAMSAQIRTRLKEQPFWKNAASILFFASLPDEVDVWPLLEETLAGENIAALPRYDSANNDYIACRVQHPQNQGVRGECNGTFFLFICVHLCPSVVYFSFLQIAPAISPPVP